MQPIGLIVNAVKAIVLGSISSPKPASREPTRVSQEQMKNLDVKLKDKFDARRHKGVRNLGIPRLGTWRKQKQGLYEKVMWPPMALRIGLLRSSALKMTGVSSPSLCSAELLRRPILRAIWGHITFS